MTRRELIKRLHEAFYPQYTQADVEQLVSILLEHMSQTLAADDRIEIRGFGSFRLRHLPLRPARNPRTGERVMAPASASPRFKPGKELARRVNAGSKLTTGRDPVRDKPRRSGRGRIARTA
ncbi:HU family DNA-binding protein [Acidihalobacter ferrooxydans]|uniref:Integration host factor subunit beta n=1 Tax=Acidihalobacter ferrooxydans TaxID=1765967 RepID=A0A1P8UFF4_9GAMM|nr:HU family DNA-binding protein [Acidihalobacter ferrooxydans]APZ42572.1 hypothetical protein BW247_05230 [Acidihalobacter ferrooxydans]